MSKLETSRKAESFLLHEFGCVLISLPDENPAVVSTVQSAIARIRHVVTQRKLMQFLGCWECQSQAVAPGLAEVTGEWRQVPARGSRGIPSWPISPARLPLHSREEALGLWGRTMTMWTKVRPGGRGCPG